MTATSPLVARHRRAGAVLGLAAVLLSLLAVLPADAAARLPVRWSATGVTVDTKVTALVPSVQAPSRSRLVLQRRDLDTWRTVDGTARRTEAGYVLRVPTWQLGRFPFRVAARRGGEVRSTSAVQTVRVRPAYSPRGRARAHTFLGSRVFRWDPCHSVRWAFNSEHAPKRGLRQVRDTIQLARQATGLRFVFAGRTDVVPRLRPTNGDFDIIIGWRTPRTFAYFRNHPGQVGVGGASWHTGFVEADGTRVDRAWSGRLILNARYRHLRPGFGRGYTWGDVLLHEFGHALGLGHVDSRDQLMFPAMTRSRARWGAGDLAGLRRLGNTRGCLTPVEPRRVGHSRAAVTPH